MFENVSYFLHFLRFLLNYIFSSFSYDHFANLSLQFFYVYEFDSYYFNFNYMILVYFYYIILNI